MKFGSKIKGVKKMAIFKTKQKMMNFQAQLEHLGKRVETFSRLNFNINQIQDLGLEFEATLRDLDIQQVCNRYDWDGLPPYLTGHLIELMLYNKGSLCGFFNGGTLYILPYAQSKGINVYGVPNAIQPITYNGAMSGSFSKFGEELLVSNIGNLNKNAKAAILYDRLPAFSQNASPIARAVLNNELIKYQCDLLGRIKNNLRNTDKKAIFWVESETQKNQMTNDLRAAYGTSDPFIVCVKGTQFLDGKDKAQTLQGDIANQTQSLFETWQSINSIRCMCAGITNGGAFEKKERKIVGELQGDQTQTLLVLDAGLKMRQLFIEQLKLIYPEYADILGKIKVKINDTSVLVGEYDTIDNEQKNGKETDEKGGVGNE